VTLVVIHYPIIDQQLLTCQYFGHCLGQCSKTTKASRSTASTMSRWAYFFASVYRSLIQNSPIILYGYVKLLMFFPGTVYTDSIVMNGAVHERISC